MGDTTDNTSSEQAAGVTQEDMQSFLDHAKKAKAQVEEGLKALELARQKADEYLKAIDAARKKADEDATYAYQAKVNTEDHAKATAVFKGQAEGDGNSTSAYKRNAEESVATITRVKADVEGDAKAINEGRKAVDQASHEIIKAAETGMSRLQETEQARNETVSSSKAAAEALTATSAVRTQAETANAEVAQFAVQAKALAGQIFQCVTDSTQYADNIAKLLTDANSSNEALHAVLEHLKKSDEIAFGHETRVAKLTEDLELLIKKAESLLPGVTSAGLASAFRDQRERFAISQGRWLRTFIFCMGLLVIVALPSFLVAVLPSFITGAASGISTWSETLHGFVLRLPILVPVVWLAIYAGRNYMLSLRLEEDYAYKQAISTAFEGYKREMKDIAAGDVKNPTPITKLCVNILTALADRPGRIYDRHNKDITPANEAIEVFKRANELGQRPVESE